MTDGRIICKSNSNQSQQMMADHAVDDFFDGDVFIYRGGRAPQHVINVCIDESVDEIEDYAFNGCRSLVQVHTHDGLRKVGREAFQDCRSLRRINLKSAIEIGQYAFFHCENLESAEFGDRLETIGYNAFDGCTCLKHLKLPSIITIGPSAFWNCKRLTDVQLSERLETIIRSAAFSRCERLQRIAIPLKRDLFEFCVIFKYNQFDKCDQLTTVDIVGGIHETVASLHMESWRSEMISEINRINQVLPNTPVNEKTNEIRLWMELVIDKMDHYKAEHCRYVKEGTILLELALWKAKLDEKKTKKVKVDVESTRKERRITCGADLVIKNILPFLQLV